MSHCWPGSHQSDGKVSARVACWSVVILDLSELLPSNSFYFPSQGFMPFHVCVFVLMELQTTTN